MREISPDFVKSAKNIGHTPEGDRYELDDETVVLVYPYKVTIEEIEREKENAKNAMRMGISVPFSFNIIKIGDNYGIIYEKLPMQSLSDCIMDDPDHFDRYVADYVSLCHTHHSTHVGYEAFLPAKSVYESYGERMAQKGIFTREEVDSVGRMLAAIPDGDAFILTTLRPASVRYYDGEPVVVYGMRSAYYGHPIIGLSGSAQMIYAAGNAGNDAACRGYNGLDCATALKFWKAFVARYFDCPSDEDAAAMLKHINFTWLLAFYTVPVIFRTADPAMYQRVQALCRKNFFPHIDEWIAGMEDCWERFL